MAIGGIPKYLNFLKPGMSAVQMLNQSCFQSQGFLCIREYLLKHVSKIKEALGIAGVSTVDTQWSSHGKDGAQILAKSFVVRH